MIFVAFVASGRLRVGHTCGVDNSRRELLELHAQMHGLDAAKRPAAALEAAQRALVLTQGNADERGELALRRFIAERFFDLAQFPEARAEAARAGALARDLGDVAAEADALALTSMCHAELDDTDAALATARAAISLLGDDDCMLMRLRGYLALSVALFAEGREAEAEAVTEDVQRLVLATKGMEERGRALWVLGNLAFITHHTNTAVNHHRRAAHYLSLTNDVSLWARFHRASAIARLLAGLADSETLDCIDRAIVAFEVSGATHPEVLRAHQLRQKWVELRQHLASTRGTTPRDLVEDPATQVRIWAELTEPDTEQGAERADRDASTHEGGHRG